MFYEWTNKSFCSLSLSVERYGRLNNIIRCRLKNYFVMNHVKYTCVDVSPFSSAANLVKSVQSELLVAR